MEIHYNRVGVKNSGLKDEGDFAVRKLEKFMTEGQILADDIKEIVVDAKYVNTKPYVAVIISFNKDSKTWESTRDYLEMFFFQKSNRIIVIDQDELTENVEKE